MHSEQPIANGAAIAVVTPNKPVVKPSIVKPSAKEAALVRVVNANQLRFSPYAWAKMTWLRDRGRNEISGFGVSSKSDILYVTDIRLVKQKVGPASVDFDKEDIARYLDDMIDQGYQPFECMRIWVHTHPGFSPNPSGTDEATFRDSFSLADWSLMVVLASDNSTTARLKLSVANGLLSANRELDVMVDCSGEFGGVTIDDAKRWEEEYQKYVNIEVWPVSAVHGDCEGYPGYEWHDSPSSDEPDPQAAMPSTADQQGNLKVEQEELYGAQGRPDDSPHLWDELESVDEAFLFDQVVVDIVADAEYVFVITEDYWFAFPSGTALKIEVGAGIEHYSDAADVQPVAFGECRCDYQSGEIVIMSIKSADTSVRLYGKLSLTDAANEIDHLMTQVHKEQLIGADGLAGAPQVSEGDDYSG